MLALKANRVSISKVVKRSYAKGWSKRVVVVGGGTAGSAVSAQLATGRAEFSVTVVDPSPFHYYQPGWTLVGAGLMDRSSTKKNLKDYISPKVNLIQDSVVSFRPEANTLSLASGKELEYDFLVVAAGIQQNWDKIKGAKEFMGKDGVCSNYTYDTVDFTNAFIRNFKGGNAIFTQPSTPIKCAGAPQKIMYLADDFWRKTGVRGNSSVMFYSGAPEIFSNPHYVPVLRSLCKDRDVLLNFKNELVEVIGNKKQAVFKRLDTGELVTQNYQFLHITPPMGAPSFIANSPLADSAGWVDVDKETLQHKKFNNVFGIGDCANLPTSKTAAAICAQVPVVVQNIRGGKRTALYDGYTSCPIVTRPGKLILAEFSGYDMKPRETFPFDQRKESSIAYFFKAVIFPQMYWRLLVKGLWKGPTNLKTYQKLKNMVKRKTY